MTERLFLKRSSMLKSPKDFSGLFVVRDKSNTIKGRYISIKFASFPHETNGPKVGFVVGKRWFKRAVHRNFIKRRLREAYRHSQGFLVKDPSYLVKLRQVQLIFIFHSRKLASTQEIFDEVNELLIQMTDRMQSNQ